MSSKSKKVSPRILHESPVILPEISNVSGNETFLVLKFGYLRSNYEEHSYIVNSSIALTHDQAKQLAHQILETLEKLEEL